MGIRRNLEPGFVGQPCVDQDITVTGSNKVAIYIVIENKMSGNGFNL